MWVRATSFSAILLFCLSLADISLAQLTPSNATYTAHGIVVNSVTGEPIQRALVQISSSGQRMRLTGADGSFEFANVPPGTVNVTVQKPGYFPEQAIHSRRAQASWIMVGPDQPPAILKLVPEAVISGRVLGDGGEPVEGLPVQVFTEQMQNGKRSWIAWRNAQTDDLGEYRLAELPPARYYVFAGPSPWPASFAPRMRTPGVSRMRAVGGARPAARGYPGVFYPAAEDRDSASPLEVKAGQHVEINFNVASQVFHTISGTVSGYSSANQGMNLQVTNAAGTPMGAGFNVDMQRGTFRTQWLPPGRYVLSAEMRDAEGHGSFASQEVSLTSDLTGVHLQLLPGATIPVNVHVEKTRSGSPDIGRAVRTWRGPRGMMRREGDEPARVLLTPLEPAMPNFHGQLTSQLGEAENAGIEIAGVPPGTYAVQVYANGPYYVQSAQCGTLNLLEQHLTVAAGASAQPIEITLRDDFGQLQGSVKLAQDAESAMVMVIPDGVEPEGLAQRIQNVQVSRPAPGFGGAESGTTFGLQLAPGTYKVIAVDQAEGFEYADPDVLRKYLDKGREITVSANQQAKIELDAVHVED